MTFFNPLASAILQGTQTQAHLAADKARQVRHAQAQQRNVGAEDDTFELQVDSPEELSPVSEDRGEHKHQAHHGGSTAKHTSDEEADDNVARADDPPPHLDLKA